MTLQFGQVKSVKRFLFSCCRTGGVNKVGVPLFKLGRPNGQTGRALLSTFVASSCDCWLVALSARGSSVRNDGGVRRQDHSLVGDLSLFFQQEIRF